MPKTLLPPGTQGNSPAPGYFFPAPQGQDYFESEAPGTPLFSHFLWILRRHLWKILVFVVTCVLLTFVISSRLVPIYESTASVDIDRQTPSGVVGQESNRMAPNDSDQFLATQIKLIQSDAVLRPVAEKYKLLEQEYQVSKLDAAKAQKINRAPVFLKQLKVTRPFNTYLLLIGYRSPDPDLAADVSNAIASSYLEHTYNIRIRSSASLSTFMEKQIEELKAKMERSGQALAAFEKELGVVNPDDKTSILSARLLQLNTEYTNAQSERVKKEAASNSMKTGSVEAAQVSSQGESLARLNERLNEAHQRIAQVKITHGSNHPEYRKAASEVAELQKQFDNARQNIASRIDVDYKQALNREQMLQKAVAETKAESDRINARSFEYQQLKREADADKKLYEELVSKIKQAGINAGFQNNNIRIADFARPADHPVFPNLRLNLMMAFLFSSLFAAGTAVLHDSLDTTVRDPEQTSRFLGTDVIALLPAVKGTTQLNRLALPASQETAVAVASTSSNGNGYHPKGNYRTISGFEEAIRTLRNTILLGTFDGRLASILVTSAGPGEGKTTAASYLAISHAEQGHKTLLVDGDLRRPSVHRKFGLKSETGFSNVLTGEHPWRDTVQPIEGKPNLFVLVSGPPSHRAADLFGRKIGDLLDEFAREFDLVILDGPPLLDFAEPLQMATVADGVLIITKAGVTKRKAVSSVLAALHRVRATVIGVVLNQVKRDTSDGYSFYGYYQSGYSSH